MSLPYSEVDICNQALAMVGADFIQALDNSTKRARACSAFYPVLRDYLLARLDWPFAKKLKVLTPLDAEQLSFKVPDGWYPYQVPSDCLAPRDLHPPGSRSRWKQFQNVLLIPVPSSAEPKLYYTARIENPSLFSMTFVNLLAVGIAARLAPSIAQDKALTSALHKQWMNEQFTVFADDANIGEDYRTYDEEPLNDTFVDPWVSGSSDLGSLADKAG